MSVIFQKRTNVNYGEAIATYNAKSAWGENPDLQMIYRTARKPTLFFEKDYQGTAKWNDFLERQGVKGPVSMNQAAVLAATELCSRIITKELLDKVSDSIIEQIKNNPERNIDKVRIVAPFPIDPSETANRFAPAFAAAMTAGLQNFLPAKLAEAGLKPMQVIADIDPSKSKPDQAILNIVNNDRGNATAQPIPGKEVDTYMERLARQPVYSGKVDKSAVYLPVDDFLVTQSTVAGLQNFIKAEGGISTPSVTGFKLFAGVEVMDTTKETLEFLNKAINDLGKHQLKEHGGVKGFKKELANTLANVGLGIDFKDPNKNTMTNIEVMFVAGYFANNQNPEHQKAFEKALAAIGSDVEQARGNSTHDVFNSPSHTLKDLQKIFDKTIPQRKDLLQESEKRFTDMLTSGRVTEYKGMQ